MFGSIEDIIKTFEERILSPQDLKLGIADWIIMFLAPIREYFESPEMVELTAQAYKIDKNKK